MREYSRKQLFFSSVAILGPGLLGGPYGWPSGEAVAVRARDGARQEGRTIGICPFFRSRPYRFHPDGGGGGRGGFGCAGYPGWRDAPPCFRTCSFIETGSTGNGWVPVKGCVYQAWPPVLKKAGVAFIGSHPMAGSEKQGMEHASGDLFRDATLHPDE